MKKPIVVEKIFTVHPSKLTTNMSQLETDHRIVLTGRVKTYLQYPEKGTLPPSCRVDVYQNDLPEFLITTSKALRMGAGVKVPLDPFQPRKPIDFEWGFTIDPFHPDFQFMTDEQQKYFFSVFDRSFPGYIKVSDSMEEPIDDGLTIEQSWKKFIELAESGVSPIIVDLTNLRPSGIENERGMVSSGALGSHGSGVSYDQRGKDSFLSVYEAIANHLKVGDISTLLVLLGQLCQTIRRGGKYKNGIITTSLRWDHNCFDEYVKFPLELIPGGSKKSARLTEDVLNHSDKQNLIVWGVNHQSVFLEKIISPDFYKNVCMAIALKDHGACLVGHANAGRCETPYELIEAHVNATLTIAKIHTEWRLNNPEKSSIYRPLDDDRQISIGWLGFANFLAQQGVTYSEMTEALEYYAYERNIQKYSGTAYVIARCLCRAYREAGIIARGYGLERAFALEPTQRCWIDDENKDLRGGYACRSVYPPLQRRERRDSDVERHSSKWYDHKPVEVMNDVGHDTMQRFLEAWQVIAQRESNGMFHGISFDLYKPIDRDWFENFMTQSPLTETYYQFASQVDQTFLDKGLICEVTDSGCSVCG